MYNEIARMMLPTDLGLFILTLNDDLLLPIIHFGETFWREIKEQVWSLEIYGIDICSMIYDTEIQNETTRLTSKRLRKLASRNLRYFRY